MLQPVTLGACCKLPGFKAVCPAVRKTPQGLCVLCLGGCTGVRCAIFMPLLRVLGNFN